MCGVIRNIEQPLIHTNNLTLTDQCGRGHQRPDDKHNKQQAKLQLDDKTFSREIDECDLLRLALERRGDRGRGRGRGRDGRLRVLLLFAFKVLLKVEAG